MAYYALLKFHVLPHDLFALPDSEQAFIYAAISTKVKADIRAAKKAKKK